MISYIDRYFENLNNSFSTIDKESVKMLAEEIFNTWKRDGKIFVFGNGGSAATSSHFVCDLSKMTIVEGAKKIKALSLSDNVPILTAWANDTNYSNIFREQLLPLVEKNDLVIGISASGNSTNVLSALECANELNVKTASLSGFDGGEISKITGFPIVVYSKNMQIIEDLHSILTHSLSLEVKCMIEKYTNMSPLVDYVSSLPPYNIVLKA
ncbi:SIS domain-containing protein [Lysinibacillus sp. NPDC097231]|uniref:D-sedoheptulose-7-phosphate isomerase n=1 Tax=Lysinibacillus sp. NPDC097231 TaxID=3364142 RepID=UPI0038182694